MKVLKKAVIFIAAAVMPALPVFSATPPIKVIHNGPGGNLLKHIRAIDSETRPVEIRGNFCFSACTLWLGYKDVCVERKTAFTFHGPKRGFSGIVLGAGMTPEDKYFEPVTQLIAEYYPSPIDDWFLEKVRYSGDHTIKGTWLIDSLGIPECAPGK